MQCMKNETVSRMDLTSQKLNVVGIKKVYCTLLFQSRNKGDMCTSTYRLRRTQTILFQWRVFCLNKTNLNRNEFRNRFCRTVLSISELWSRKINKFKILKWLAIQNWFQSWKFRVFDFSFHIDIWNHFRRINEPSIGCAVQCIRLNTAALLAIFTI